MQYLKTYGERLIALGYRIVPLPPGSKGPRKAGWQRLEATPEMVRQWTSNGSADDGIGVLAARTPAIDVDIPDPAIAARMQEALTVILGGIPHLRIGKAPKFLIPFRCESPFRKVQSTVYYDPLTDTEHRVEILADGQQWVAYHEHPDTKQPYTWPQGGLLDTPYAQLPVLTPELAREVIDAFEAMASVLVMSGQWEVKQRPAKEHAPAAPADPLMDYKPTIDFQTLKDALRKIPNKGKDELAYEQWFQVIAAIHHETHGQDHGLQLAHAWSKRASKYDPVFLDERVWPYIKHDRANAVTGRTIIHLAKQYPDRLPIERPKAGLIQMAEFAQLKPISWLVKGVLPQAEIAIVYGASGSGKSFFVLDLVAAVARGVEWRGRKTKQSPVVYVAAEGAGGFRARVNAYGSHHNVNLSSIPLYVLPSPVDLADGYLELADQVKSVEAGIVVIDTLAATTPGMDENTGKDMGRVMDACRQIHAATGALVILIHHSGKDTAQGARGWSGMRAACDAEFQVSQEGDERAVRVTKQKDGEEGLEFGFKLRVIEIGEDEDGESITSCAVREAEITKPMKAVKLSDSQQFILEVFDKSLGMADDMTAEELVEAVKASQKEFGEKPGKASNLLRSIERLVGAGLLSNATGKLSRV